MRKPLESGVRACAVTAALSTIFVVGCTFESRLPADAFIRCGDDGACPVGSVCIEALQRCVASSRCVLGEGTDLKAAEDGVSCGDASICIQGVCVDEACGDGFVASGEECDDGEDNSDERPDACRTACRRASCGDAVTDTDEGCDDGEGNSDAVPDACRSDCTPARCGDRVVDTAEICDDGVPAGGSQPVSGDGCRLDCGKIEVCGDGAVDVGEECDDANGNERDACGSCQEFVWTPEILSGFGAEGGDPSRLVIAPVALAVDRTGNLFVADLLSGMILRLDGERQKVTRFAGTGTLTSIQRPGLQGARSTDVNVAGVFALAVSAAGDVILGDIDESKVRRIELVSGRTFDVAGNGVAQSNGDGGLGILAALGDPRDVLTDGNGNVIVTDYLGNRVRRIDRQTGIITTIAGNGQPPSKNSVDDGDGGSPLLARVRAQSIGLDRDGNLWLWDDGNIMRRLLVDPADRSRFVTIERVMAFPQTGDTMESMAVAADGQTAWVTSRSRHQIFEFDLIERTHRAIAGIGEPGFDGDAADALAVRLNRPKDIAVFNDDTVFFTDPSSGHVRRLDRNPDQTWRITTLMGAGIDATAGETSYLAPRVLQAAGGGIGLLPRPECTDKVDIALSSASLHQVFFKDSCTGSFRLIAGNGERGSSGDDGPALQARLITPRGTAVDGATGDVLVADPDAHVVRRIVTNPVTKETTIRRVAGTGVAGFTGDGGLATEARLNGPAAVAIDDQGRIIIADTGNHRLRRIDPRTQVITTLVGTGVGIPGADGINLATQTIAEPVSVLFLSATLLQPEATGGILFFVERTGHRVRAILDVAIEGIPALLLPVQTTTLAGDGTAGYIDATDGLQARFDHPRALGGLVDESCPRGCVLVLDGIDRVRRLALSLASGLPPRLLASVATDTGGALATDDGPLSTARLPGPTALAAFGEQGALLTDRVTGRLRHIDLAAERIETVAGLPEGIDVGTTPVSALLARPFNDPSGVAVDEAAEPAVIYVTERGAHTIRRVVAVDPAEPSTWTTDLYCGSPNAPGHVDGDCAQARFDAPAGLAIDAARGMLFVADQGSHVVRRIDLNTDEVVTLVGQVGVRGVLVGLCADVAEGDAAPVCDGLPGPEALLDTPAALAVVGESLFVTDAGSHRVVRVDGAFANDPFDATVFPVLGDGVAASSGEGEPAAFFTVDTPEALSADADGNLYIASQQTVRFVAAGDDRADGYDVVASVYGKPPRARFPEPVTQCINALTTLPDGQVLAVDGCVGLLVRLHRQPKSAGRRPPSP
jgi:sugar lactone lactonase YvrE